MRTVMISLINRKVSRFVLCGAVTAGFNLALLVIVIEGLRIETGLGRSVANLACTEIAVLFSFFVYKIFVWRDARWTARELVTRQIPIYHASVATSFVVRTLAAFPLLDAVGVHYTLNLLIGIALGAAVNFLISDRFVFGHAGPVALPVETPSTALGASYDPTPRH